MQKRSLLDHKLYLLLYFSAFSALPKESWKTSVFNVNIRISRSMPHELGENGRKLENSEGKLELETAKRGMKMIVL